MDASTVSPQDLQLELASSAGLLVVDVRPTAAFLSADAFLSGALRGPSHLSTALLAGRSLVLYCDDGGETSSAAARAFGRTGPPVRVLEGGLRAWRANGGPVLPKPAGASTLWVTRERPKIDRIACPWLVTRFIDEHAEFRYVPAANVVEVARRERAIPFDIPDTLFSHEGERCSFDAFLRVFRLDDPSLGLMARIIRGADTGRLDMAPESAGLLAASLGLSRLRSDDLDMLKEGLVLYDALYLWARHARQETHTWNPDLYRRQETR